MCLKFADNLNNQRPFLVLIDRFLFENDPLGRVNDTSNTEYCTRRPVSVPQQNDTPIMRRYTPARGQGKKGCGSCPHLTRPYVLKWMRRREITDHPQNLWFDEAPSKKAEKQTHERRTLNVQHRIRNSVVFCVQTILSFVLSRRDAAPTHDMRVEISQRCDRSGYKWNKKTP